MLYDQYFIDDLKDRADLVRQFRFIAGLLFAVAIFGMLAPKTMAQKETPPVLLGDFETFPCSEFRYIADQFMETLASDPGSLGYVVNTGPYDRLAALVWREELVKAQIDVRNFDVSRVLFDREEVAGGVFRTQFWKISSPQGKPKIENVNNSLSVSPDEKPFLLIEQTFFNDSECPDVNYPRIFVRFLEANPVARGNLVIYGKNRAEIRSRETKVIMAITSTNKIDRNRIRVFQRLVRYDPEQPKGREYWYLP
ncbi:MAG: hypothetical protein ACRD6X_13775 [Pyrinomonadaceae bacterium]